MIRVIRVVEEVGLGDKKVIRDTGGTLAYKDQKVIKVTRVILAQKVVLAREA